MTRQTIVQIVLATALIGWLIGLALPVARVTPEQYIGVAATGTPVAP